jgi:hypothetical protein
VTQTTTCCADPANYTFAGIDTDPSVGYVGEAYFACTCGSTISAYDFDALALMAPETPQMKGMATALDMTYAATEKETA